MELLRRIARRARLIIRRGDIERSMDAEMRHHLDLETADLVRQGLDPAAARREALVRFGGVEQAKEWARDARGGRRVEDAVADLRYAARILIRHRGLTLASIATLALGIGAPTAIMSVVYGVLLRPLPYSDPDKLMVLWEHDVARNRADNVVSLDNFEAWEQRAGGFSSMAAVIPTSATFTDGPEPERVVGAEVTAGYFPLLGVSPALGRDFNDADHRDTLSILLSDAYWRRRFGGDPSVVGRVRTISGRPYTIVGVMPPFDPPRIAWLDTQDVWFPMPRTADRRAWGRSLIVLGRLRRGVSPTEARAEMQAIAAQLAIEIPADHGWSATVVPLATEMTGGAAPPLFVLLGAAVVLLGLAVTNVATLTLAATGRRRQELAVRRAIGASDAACFGSSLRRARCSR